MNLFSWGGYILLFAVNFSETGLFAGLFLPGDSLLITAGLIAASGDLDIRAVIATLIAGAVCGDSTGYLIGRQLQKNFFKKEDSRFFHRKHLQKNRGFLSKTWGKSCFSCAICTGAPQFCRNTCGRYRYALQGISLLQCFRSNYLGTLFYFYWILYCKRLP